MDTRTNDDHYVYKGDVSCTYENITLDASLKLSNDMSKRLEPYDMNELEDFNISYLSGYYADRYDVPYAALEGITHSRCQNFLRSEILQSCEYANKIGNLPVERRTYILRFIKNAVIACMVYSILSVLFLLHPKLYVCFLFPILIYSILIYQNPYVWLIIITAWLVIHL